MLSQKKCHASFGEMIQGQDINMQYFLITLPIQLYSHATFEPQMTSKEVMIFPSNFTKSYKAAKSLLKDLNIDKGGVITINSEIPLGKGLSGSSADIVATIKAICNYYKIQITQDSISKYCVAIERSDAVRYKDNVRYDNVNGRILKNYGQFANLSLIAIDLGGESHTSNFLFNYTDVERKEFSNMVKEFDIAVKNNCLNTIGQLCTKSAIINQRFNYKNHLDTLINISKENNCLGVVTTHTGTMSAIIINQKDPEHEIKMINCEKELEKITNKVYMFNSLI